MANICQHPCKRDLPLGSFLPICRISCMPSTAPSFKLHMVRLFTAAILATGHLKWASQAKIRQTPILQVHQASLLKANIDSVCVCARVHVRVREWVCVCVLPPSGFTIQPYSVLQDRFSLLLLLVLTSSKSSVFASFRHGCAPLLSSYSCTTKNSPETKQKVSRFKIQCITAIQSNLSAS